jgi:hypothetical protein
MNEALSWDFGGVLTGMIAIKVEIERQALADLTSALGLELA